MIFDQDKLEAAAISALEQGQFIEAVVLWQRYGVAKGGLPYDGCGGGFSLQRCADCFENWLISKSLRCHKRNYNELALRLKHHSTTLIRT